MTMPCLRLRTGQRHQPQSKFFEKADKKHRSGVVNFENCMVEAALRRHADSVCRGPETETEKRTEHEIVAEFFQEPNRDIDFCLSSLRNRICSSPGSVSENWIDIADLRIR